jgi:hypothetical protein
MALWYILWLRNIVFFKKDLVMRLYTAEERIVPQFTQENFNAYYQTASVVAEEALSDFFYKLKDSLNTLTNKLPGVGQETVVSKILSSRFETEHVVKRIKLINLKDELVAKPENFKGKYVDYLNDLSLTADLVTKDTHKTLNNVKLAISGFINEYSEDQVTTLYGGVYFKETEKLIDKSTKQIAKYFPTANGGVKAYVGDLLKSLNDVNEIHRGIDALESIINEEKIIEINRLAVEAASLVDLLIEQNQTSGVLLRNSHVKKELISALHVAAREVEFMSYLYSNAIYFYSAYKELTDLLIKKSN